jgi:hypothetical protein
VSTEGHEQAQPVGVLHLAEVLAVQLGLDGVHHHARLHVVDPEVLVAAVAQARHGAQGQLLGLFARQLAGHFLCMRPAHQAAGHFDNLPRGFAALLQHLVDLALDQQTHHPCRKRYTPCSTSPSRRHARRGPSSTGPRWTWRC